MRLLPFADRSIFGPFIFGALLHATGCGLAVVGSPDADAESPQLDAADAVPLTDVVPVRDVSVVGFDVPNQWDVPTLQDVPIIEDTGSCHSFNVLPPEYTIEPAGAFGALPRTGGRILDGMYVLRNVRIYSFQPGNELDFSRREIPRIALQIVGSEWRYRLLFIAPEFREMDQLGMMTGVRVAPNERMVYYGRPRCRDFIPYAFSASGYSEQPDGFDLAQDCAPRSGYGCVWQFRRVAEM